MLIRVQLNGFAVQQKLARTLQIIYVVSKIKLRSPTIIARARDEQNSAEPCTWPRGCSDLRRRPPTVPACESAWPDSPSRALSQDRIPSRVTSKGAASVCSCR